MIQLNIETITGKLPKFVAKATGSRSKQLPYSTVNNWFKNAEVTGDFLTQYSNRARLWQDLHEMECGTRYEKLSKVERAEVAKKLRAKIEILVPENPLTTPQIEALWASAKETLTELDQMEDFVDVCYHQDGITAYPVFQLHKKS